MSKHETLLAHLRSLEDHRCDLAGDAIVALERENEALQAKVATVIEELNWLATCRDGEMLGGDAARKTACELIALLGGPVPKGF